MGVGYPMTMHSFRSRCVAGWESQQQWLASSTKQAAGEVAAALNGLELKERMLQSYKQAA